MPTIHLGETLYALSNPVFESSKIIALSLAQLNVSIALLYGSGNGFGLLHSLPTIINSKYLEFLIF